MFDDAMAAFEKAPRRAAAAVPARVVTFAWPEYDRPGSPEGSAGSVVAAGKRQDAAEDSDEVQDTAEESVQSFTASHRDSCVLGNPAFCCIRDIRSGSFFANATLRAACLALTPGCRLSHMLTSIGRKGRLKMNFSMESMLHQIMIHMI